MQKNCRRKSHAWAPLNIIPHIQRLYPKNLNIQKKGFFFTAFKGITLQKMD
jgi:hypothetical protein